MIVEIQCLPSPAGLVADPYRHIEATIGVVERSGLKYEVGALGTTFEGDPEAVWLVARRAHEACLAAGANTLVTVLKVFEAAPALPSATIESLTGKFRA